MKKVLLSLLVFAASITAMADSYSSLVQLKITSGDSFYSTLTLGEGAASTTTGVLHEEGGVTIALYANYDSKKCEALTVNGTLGNLPLGFKATQSTSYTITCEYADGSALYLKNGENEPVQIATTMEPVVVNIEDAQKGTFVEGILSLYVAPAPEEYIHHRNVAAGSFGTICFPNKITAMEGVKDGKLLEFVTNGVTFVEAQEVALEDMETGKAYIFEASADAQSFTYDPATSEASPIDNNGLVGTFAEEGIAIDGKAWIIKGNAIKEVLAGSSVPQYRAYIPSLDDIQTIPASGAPVRRFLVGEATGLQEIKAMEGTRKAIVNGRLVIIREGRMFNALGGRK